VLLNEKAERTRFPLPLEVHVMTLK